MKSFGGKKIFATIEEYHVVYVELYKNVQKKNTITQILGDWWRMHSQAMYINKGPGYEAKTVELL